MNETILLRKKIPRDVFDYQMLKDVLSDKRKPRDKITKLLQSGVIIRIRKGLYCFHEDLRKEPVIKEYLANLIYGPSYVSLDYALAYHGLIPERVETVTSVTTKRSGEFHTPLGVFSYRRLPESKYSIGALWESAGDTSYLLASPEKALIDKIWADKRLGETRVSDYAQYLIEDLRIDPGALSRLDYNRLKMFAQAFDSEKINRFLRFLIQEYYPHDADY